MGMGPRSAHWVSRLGRERPRTSTTSCPKFRGAANGRPRTSTTEKHGVAAQPRRLARRGWNAMTSLLNGPRQRLGSPVASTDATHRRPLVLLALVGGAATAA